jgi:histidine ammonia-lyase
MKPGEGTCAAYRCIRKVIPHLDRDRVLSRDIEAMTGLIRDGSLIRAVEDAVGPLHP